MSLELLNWAPLSVMIANGNPYLAKMLDQRKDTTAWVVALAIGSASIHLVK